MPDLFPLAGEAVLILGTTRVRAIVGTSHIVLIQRGRHSATSHNDLLALFLDSCANVIEAAPSNVDVRKTRSSITCSSNCVPLSTIPAFGSLLKVIHRRNWADIQYWGSEWETVVNGGLSTSWCVLVRLYRVVPTIAHLRCLRLLISRVFS